MERRLRQFACPYEPQDERIFELIAATYGAATVERFLATYRGDVESQTSGMLRLLEDWLAREPDFETVWDLAFGRAEVALMVGGVDPLEVAIRLGMRMMVGGQPGAWTASVEGTRALAWDRYVLPAATAITAESDGKQATLDLEVSPGSPLHLAFVRDYHGWTCPDLEPLPQIGSLGRLSLLAKPALPGNATGGKGFDDLVAVPSIERAAVTAFEGGLRLLSEHVPVYAPWAERILRSLVVCEADPTFKAVSGSWEDAPGVIHVSYPLSPLAIAEMLVHEATHQYYYLLERLGPVDDGSDPELYYSPAVDRERPLSRILVAYHAFANVLLFYDECLSKEIDDAGYCAKNAAKMSVQVEQLDRPLRGNAALTMLGNTLYRPLAERMDRVLPRLAVGIH